MLSFNTGKDLWLHIADNLTQIVARHRKCITITITKLGATDLCIRHTLIMQMSNLEGNEGKNEAVKKKKEQSQILILEKW